MEFGPTQGLACPAGSDSRDRPEDETMADSQLAQRVDAVLRSNPHISHRNLRFEANQGQVVLRGTVRSYYQKLMAQEALLSVEGVEAIENQLEVQWRT